MKSLRVPTILLCLLAVASIEAVAESMVLIKGGGFVMGVQGGTDNPAHLVEVSTFFLSKYEVTVGDWRTFTRAEGIDWPWHSDSFEGEIGLNRAFDLPADWPIYQVSWYAAVYYCNWLSRQRGLDRVYEFDARHMTAFVNLLVSYPPVVKWNRTSNGFRLPTEAEWEYAAVTGHTGSSLMDEAWFRTNAGDRIHSVGGKKPNGLGLYDMLGNVGEWCWDYFDPRYYLVSPAKNPIGPNRGYDPENFDENESEIHVNRGADYLHTQEYESIRFRFRSLAALRATIGLRLAANAPDSSQ